MKANKGKITLDELDWGLIQKLEIHGRQTNVELARQLGVSESTIRRRIERLQNEGVIKVAAVPNLQKIGWGVRAIVMLQAEPSKLQAIVARLAKQRNVHYLAQCTGNYNLVFWILCPAIGDLAKFVRTEISNVDGIKANNTVIEVELFKRTYDWLPVNGSS